MQPEREVGKDSGIKKSWTLAGCDAQRYSCNIL